VKLFTFFTLSQVQLFVAPSVLKAHKGINTDDLVFELARMDIILPNGLEQRFREEVFKRYGMKKGNITIAIQEAIEQWILKGERMK